MQNLLNGASSVQHGVNGVIVYDYFQQGSNAVDALSKNEQFCLWCKNTFKSVRFFLNGHKPCIVIRTK